MGNIKFNASKKTTIILLVVLFFVIGGSGGYLLWRVNQQKSVAPSDSEAGEYMKCCCPKKKDDGELDYSHCAEGTGCKCVYGGWCPDSGLPECKGNDLKCKTGQECNPYVNCIWPQVAYCYLGECMCAQEGCNPNYEPCNPDCPAGYTECPESGCTSSDIKKASCKGNCEGCNNAYTRVIECQKFSDPEPPQPKCGDGKVNQPNEECDPPGAKVCPGNLACSSKCTCPCDGEGKDSGISFTPPTVKKDGTLSYRYTMGDSKGIDLNSVRVLVNHSSFDVEKNLTPDTGTPKKATVDGKLDTSKVGNYHVLIAWKRPGESSFSELCQMRGNFTVEDVGAPKWDVAKTASEECIVDSDGESIAKLTYTITIKNNGNVTGTITTVTDKLDSKVVDGSVTDISDGGTYSSSDRSIKWGQFDIPAGQTKTLTYSFTVRKDAFGVYDNVVIVKPSDGADYVANASITADCVEEPYQPPVEGGKVPDTGLFDESENLVIMGGILLFLGLGWTWLNRTYQIVNGKLVQRSKERFEQRVVKN